jgi:hypothetical protein
MMSKTGLEQFPGGGSFAWSMPSIPLLSVFTDINGKWLEGAVRTQKDWAEFVHRRVKEDISASQQMMNCRSITDMQEIYSQYWRTALDQYREQSEKILQTGKSITEDLAQTMESRAREATRRVQH